MTRTDPFEEGEDSVIQPELQEHENIEGPDDDHRKASRNNLVRNGGLGTMRGYYTKITTWKFIEVRNQERSEKITV